MSKPRPISSLLVANRGEIAQRILQSARELGITTYALHTTDDLTHARFADHALSLPDPESYMDTERIIGLCIQHRINAIHPGYGFLSESADFAARAEAEGIKVIGPGAVVLARTGDKLEARRLATGCGVPVLEALATPTREVGDISAFASRVGYPIMIKAVDGGGGRGIRLVRRAEDLESSMKRAVEESPSKLVFAEKAAVDKFLHVEVQIVGDGTDVIHLLERQCSIQRKYQKVVEVAPCIKADRKFIKKVIDAAVKMAKSINYMSLGTFEFLANPTTKEFYFLEINPRLQVEHTLTETILDMDLVRTQLLIAQGVSLSAANLPKPLPFAEATPNRFACQLRLTAEDVSKGWALGIGKISEIQLPCGNGVRVDSALALGQVIGSSFDSLLAKIIVSGPTWQAVVQKAKRALQDTMIKGVKSNIDILRGIVASPDFATRDCDTTWLEKNQQQLLDLGIKAERSPVVDLPQTPIAVSEYSSVSGGTPLFRKGDSWTLDLKPAGGSESKQHHLAITRILRNEFPTSLSAEVEFTPPAGDSQEYELILSSTTASANAVMSQHRRGDLNNPRHVVIPFPGKLIEVMVDEGDVVKADDVICVVQQMKMEIEIRAKRGGRVVWVTDVEDGEEVNEGVLAAIIDPGDGPKL